MDGATVQISTSPPSSLRYKHFINSWFSLLCFGNELISICQHWFTVLKKKNSISYKIVPRLFYVIIV